MSGLSFYGWVFIKFATTTGAAPQPVDLAGPVACERSREDREMIAALSFTYMYLSRGGSNYEVRALRLFAVRARKIIHKKCGMSIWGKGAHATGCPCVLTVDPLDAQGCWNVRCCFPSFHFNWWFEISHPSRPLCTAVANLFWHALKSSTFRPSSTCFAVLRMDEVGEWMCVCFP